MLALCANAACAYRAQSDPWQIHATADNRESGNTIAPGKDGVHRYQLTHKDANGGLCLDGSPPTFHFAAANPDSTADSDRTKEWVIYLQGGAWCTDLKSCYRRSLTSLGSSNANMSMLSNTTSPALSGTALSSWLSSDSKVNPSFHESNRVQVDYCDGASFSSDVAEPQTVVVNGERHQLYFRGRKVLEAVMRHLYYNMGLWQAERVLLAGSGSGGVAALLQHVTVQTFLPATVTTYKVYAESAWFQMVPPAGRTEANSPWMNSMRQAFKLHNVLRSVPHGQLETCLPGVAAGDEWHCMMPYYVAPTAQVPVFLAQSGFDSWQLVNVHRDDWACLKKQTGNLMLPTPADNSCTPLQAKRLSDFAGQLTTELLGALSGSLSSQGNGAFISPCVQHELEIGSDVTRLPPLAGYSVSNDRQTLAKAVNTWWWDSPNDDFYRHVYVPCGEAEMDIHTQVSCEVACAPDALPNVGGHTGIIGIPGGYDFKLDPLGLPHVGVREDIEECTSVVACEPNAAEAEELANWERVGMPLSTDESLSMPSSTNGSNTTNMSTPEQEQMTPFRETAQRLRAVGVKVNAIPPTRERPAVLDSLS